MAFRPLLGGTLALTAAGLYARITGSFYRILLVRIVGDTGIGLFQMTLPIYSLACTLAVMGLPTALSKTVGERLARGDWQGAIRARRIATLLVTAGTTVTIGLLWVAAGPIAEGLLTEPRTLPPLKVMPLAVLIAANAAILRGYFHGLQDLIPSAAAQVIEQTVRIGSILILASVLLPYGLGAAAAGAMIGLALGELGGLLCLALWHFRRENTVRTWRSFRGGPASPGTSQTAANLMSLGLPMMAVDMVSSLTAAADAVIIPQRLHLSGLPWDEAAGLYGELMGLFMPLLFLPMVLTYPVAITLIPGIAAARATGNAAALNQQMLRGTRVAFLVSLAAGALFWLASGFLSQLLSGSPESAPMVRMLAVAAPFVYVQSMENAVLIGLGLNSQSFRNYLAGVAVRLTLIYFLTGNPALGITGALMGIIAGQIVMGVLHALEIKRATGRLPF